MQIVLIRHAKVLIENQNSTTANEMNRWVEEYNHAPIDSTLPKNEVVSLYRPHLSRPLNPTLLFSNL